MKILQILYMLMKFNNLFSSFSMVVLVPIFSFAQEQDRLEVLITDRPDATESPYAMTGGFLQIETGAAFETFENASIKTEYLTYNTTLLRYGLLHNLEFRIGWDFVEGRTKINGTTLEDVTSGFSPLLFGFKTNIAKENGWFPDIGFLGHLYLPFTAGTDYRPETTGVDFRFAFAHTITDNSSLSYNLGAEWSNDSPEAAYIYSISYGHGITDKLGMYAELYGDLPENSKSNHFWDGGVTYLVSNNLQLDATIGSSITKGQDILISAGFSYRVPNHSK